MAKTKTVRATDNGAAVHINFSTAEIAEFGRVDATSGWIKWKVALQGKDMPKLFRHMGWALPEETRQRRNRFEKKLTGGNFTNA